MKGPSFPQVLLALCLSWLLCFVLTVTNALPSAPTAYGYLARTDTKGNVLSQAPWFRVPYPGKEKTGIFLPGTHVSQDYPWGQGTGGGVEQSQRGVFSTASDKEGQPRESM